MSYSEAQYTVDEILAGLRGSLASGIPPKNLAYTISAADARISITFTPEDTIVDGILLCTVGGVHIRYKKGSAPVNIQDGMFGGDYTGDELHAHSSEPVYIDGLLNGEEYFVRLFVYSDHGVFNNDAEHHTASATPTGSAYYGFRQDFDNLDPDTNITYLGENENYVPMVKNPDAGVVTDGSWLQWPWLKKNKPYMVKADTLQADYQLLETNYLAKADSTGESDVANVNYNGGAFAWLPRLYMREIYSQNGKSRYVYFSETAADGYTPVGFKDTEGNVLKGVWIPMFYTSVIDNVTHVIANQSPGEERVATEDMQLAQLTFTGRAKALGGPIMNVIRDVLYMLCKSTNVQEKLGYGLGVPTTTTADINAIVDSGRFKGSSKLSLSLNKAFHSIVLMSNARYLADLYFKIPRATNDAVRIYGSATYNDSAVNTDTGIDLFTDNLKYIYQTRLKYAGDGLGSITAWDPLVDATSDTGLCDVCRGISSGYGNTYVYSLFRGGAQPSTIDMGGPAFMTGYRPDVPAYHNTIAIMLLPPVDYTPETEVS